MAFQLEVKTGDAGPIIMRGCSDGTVEFCKWGESTDPKTKVKSPALIPYKYYNNLEQAFNRVLSMRVCSYDAQNIKDLVQGIRLIRDDLKKEMGSLN